MLSEPHSLTCLDTVDPHRSGVTATLNDPCSKVLSNGWNGSVFAVQRALQRHAVMLQCMRRESAKSRQCTR